MMCGGLIYPRVNGAHRGVLEVNFLQGIGMQQPVFAKKYTYSVGLTMIRWFPLCTFWIQRTFCGKKLNNKVKEVGPVRATLMVWLHMGLRVIQVWRVQWGKCSQ